MAKLSRHEANCLIMVKLQQLIDKYPDQRFNQLLQNAGVTDPAADLYYEESERTLEVLEERIKEAVEYENATNIGSS